MSLTKNNAQDAVKIIIDKWKNYNSYNNVYDRNTNIFLKNIFLEKYNITVVENFHVKEDSLSKFLLKSDTYIQKNNIIKELYIEYQPILEGTKHSVYSYKFSVNGDIGFYSTDFTYDKIKNNDEIYIEICEICNIKMVYTAINWFDKIFDTNLSFSNMEYHLDYIKIKLTPK